MRQNDFIMHMHSNEGNIINMHQNLITIVLIINTLSKLRSEFRVVMSVAISA
jgi:hypothetical protein